ncbi:MAG: CoA transferase [Pseudomonadota bacterium]
MDNANDNFLSGISVLQLATESSAEVTCTAVDLAGQMARQLGATVFVDDHFQTGEAFRSRGKQRLTEAATQWLAADPLRFVLAADTAISQQLPQDRVVTLEADELANEAVLFAESGLADLLGDPQQPPIIPTGSYGAGTVAYSLLAALTSLVAMQRRFGVSDRATVNAAGSLAWVNWKAAAAGVLGKDIHRQGDTAEWPVIACRDGYAALVYQERDWPNVVAMVGDPRLQDDRFATFAGRATARSEYMDIIRGWAQGLTKAEIDAAFQEFDIPAASVLEAEDLIKDPLLLHRDAFTPVSVAGTSQGVTPRLAHRVISRSAEPAAPVEQNSGLPLAGIRVLDLGIITAGAGVSALLADLGAEVIKVESHTYPDPFRIWAGQAVSPLFKCNNRNKYAITLDLKDPGDKARFLSLVETADVVVENFRRGVLERLGLGYATLSATNPGIMLASISGQGLSGPGCGSSSFGSTLEASSGFSAHLCYSDGTPYITGRNVNYPDQTVVLYAAAVITAALSGETRGMQLDISQRDVAVFLAGEEIEQSSAGLDLTPQYNGQAFRTSDDQWVAFQPPEGFGDAHTSLDDWLRQFTAAELMQTLRDLKVGAAPVNSGSLMHASFTERGIDVFARSPDGAMVKGFPFQFARQPMTIRLNSPDVGEHTERFCS